MGLCAWKPLKVEVRYWQVLLYRADEGIESGVSAAVRLPGILGWENFVSGVFPLTLRPQSHVGTLALLLRGIY